MQDNCRNGQPLLKTGRDAQGREVILLNAPETGKGQQGAQAPVKDLMAAVRGKMEGKLRRPKVWTKDELVLRSWIWRDDIVEPHESLTRVVAELNEVSRAQLFEAG